MAGNQVTDPETLAFLRGGQTAPVADNVQADLRTISAAESAWEDTSPLDQFGVGIAKPLRQAWLGGKDLFTDLSDEEKRELLMLEQVTGGYATSGQIVGDVATLAIPGGMVAKGAQKLATGLPRALAALAPIAAESALVGGYEGLKAPETGESRGGNAGQAAMMTGALGAGMQVLGKTGRALAGQVTPKAREMLDRGVPLTPGMAREGGLATTAERFMMDVPFTGDKVKAMQDVANKQWNKEVLQQVAPKGYAITKPGRDGFKQLQTAFNKSYSDLWNGVKIKDVNLADLGKNWTAAGKELDVLPPDLKAPLKAVYAKAGEQINSYMKSAGDVKMLEHLDDMLREAVGDADKISAKHLRNFRKSLHAALPPEAAAKLRAVDGKYAQYAVAQKAGSYLTALERDSVFAHRQLQSAIKNKEGERALVTGKGRLQDFADEAEQTFGRVTPQRSQINVGQPVIAAVTAGGGLTKPLRTGAALLGSQKAVNETMRKALTREYSPMPYQSALARALRAAAGTSSND